MPSAIATVIGVLLGNRLAGRVPAERLTKWFVFMLIAAYTGRRSLHRAVKVTLGDARFTYAPDGED